MRLYLCILTILLATSIAFQIPGLSLNVNIFIFPFFILYHHLIYPFPNQNFFQFLYYHPLHFLFLDSSPFFAVTILSSLFQFFLFPPPTLFSFRPTSPSSFFFSLSLSFFFSFLFLPFIFST